MVADSTWCTILVSPLRNWSATAGSSTGKRVEKRKKPRKERLRTSAPQPARISKPVVG